MFQEIFITEITTSDLQVCRGCLATDVRLYDMRQNRLMEAYSTLLSADIQVTEDLPHYLCSYCAALLFKCDTFRIKCINTQFVLKSAILPNLQLTLENIKQIECPAYLRQSYIQTIDIDDTYPKSNNNTDNLLEPVKEEFDDDKNDTVDNLSDNSNDTIDNVSDNSNDNINDNCNKQHKLDDKVTSVSAVTTRKRKIKNTVTKKQTKMKLEDQSGSKVNLVKDEDIITKTKNNVGFSNHDEINEINSDEDEVLKKKILKAKPNGNKKTENVSKLYNMDEVNISKEEQLKEIEDRKNSEPYLHAHFKCEFCYKGFRSKVSFDTHMVLHDERSGNLVCDICRCHFHTKQRLNKHKSTHKKKFTCKHGSCTYVTKHLSQAREHYKWHSGVKEICKHCGKECSGQTTYYHHLKLHHPTSDDLVRCEICGTSCSGTLGFKMHEQRMHKEMFSPEYHCSVCETQFYCSDAFKAHRGTDGVCDTTHKYCVRCGESFDTEELLKEHEIEQRKPRTMFKCEECNKEFEGHTSLKKHQLGHALTLTRQVICEICGKVLSNHHTLRQHHLNRHSTVNPIKCTECPKTFRCFYNLQLHNRIHTGERPHSCSLCPSTFRSVTNLRRHELVHTNERPHVCEICGKAFKTKADCKAHVQTVHMRIYRPRVRRKYKKTD